MMVNDSKIVLERSGEVGFLLETKFYDVKTTTEQGLKKFLKPIDGLLFY